MFKRKRDEGFTLIELMIVIAVIGILAVVLIPKIGNVKTSAKLAGVETNFHSVIATVQAGQSYYTATTDTGADITTVGSVGKYLAGVYTSTNTITNPLSGGTNVAAATTSPVPAVIVLSAAPASWGTTYGGAVVVVPNLANGTGSVTVYACDDTGNPLAKLTTTLSI